MKTKQKGFTLVEMVIVLALFSVVMFSVAQLLTPVTKFYVRTSNYETSTACNDNIKRAIEGNLKYADRVRVYQNFDPNTNLDTHVQSFWSEFFEDRQFLDCQGTIYAMVFDNEAPHVSFNSALNRWVVDTAYTNLEEFMDAQINSGKITLYQYSFDNTTLDVAGRTETEWYVNQKMYGNYNYQFALGSNTDMIGSSTSFDPADCTITVRSYEVSRGHDQTTDPSLPANYLVVSTTGMEESASFSMKNVLDPAHNYTQPLDDFKLILNPSRTGGYGGVGAQNRYIPEPDPFDSTKPYLARSRYLPMTQAPCDLHNAATVDFGGADLSRTFAAIPGFYFIYTLPDSVHDIDMSPTDNLPENADDRQYMQEIEAIFPPT